MVGGDGWMAGKKTCFCVNRKGGWQGRADPGHSQRAFNDKRDL